MGTHRGDLDDYQEVEPLLLSKIWETVISERGNTREAWETLIDGEEYSLLIFPSLRNLLNVLEDGVADVPVDGLSSRPTVIAHSNDDVKPSMKTSEGVEYVV